jgi:hypothetical protein
VASSILCGKLLLQNLRRFSNQHLSPHSTNKTRLNPCALRQPVIIRGARAGTMIEAHAEVEMTTVGSTTGTAMTGSCG